MTTNICVWYCYDSDIRMDYPKLISEKWNLTAKFNCLDGHYLMCHLHYVSLCVRLSRSAVLRLRLRPMSVPGRSIPRSHSVDVRPGTACCSCACLRGARLCPLFNLVYLGILTSTSCIFQPAECVWYRVRHETKPQTTQVHIRVQGEGYIFAFQLWPQFELEHSWVYRWCRPGLQNVERTGA